MCLAEVKRLWEGFWSHQELASGVSKSHARVMELLGTKSGGFPPSLPPSYNLQELQQAIEVSFSMIL